MINFIPSKHALNTGKQSVIIILQYPLQEKINDFLERSFYPLMNVFFKRADRLKPIAICSSWRVQKWSSFHHQNQAANMQNVNLIIKNTDQHASQKKHGQGGLDDHYTTNSRPWKSPCI